ncbi:MAG: phage holin family protein [Burkholderiales bacterium]
MKLENEDPSPRAGGGPAMGLLDSLRQLASTVIETLQTRIELASAEIEEEGARMAGLMLIAAAGFYCLTIGLVFGGLFIVVALWDTYRLWAVGGITLFFVGSALILWLVFRHRYKTRPRFLSATVAEFRKDRDMLRRAP